MGSVLMYASERSSHCQNRGDLSIRREREKKVVECGKAMEIEKWVREGERDRDPLSFHRL